MTIFCRNCEREKESCLFRPKDVLLVIDLPKKKRISVCRKCKAERTARYTAQSFVRAEPGTSWRESAHMIFVKRNKYAVEV
jgi:hypothetical protein